MSRGRGCGVGGGGWGGGGWEEVGFNINVVCTNIVLNAF